MPPRSGWLFSCSVSRRCWRVSYLLAAPPASIRPLLSGSDRATGQETKTCNPFNEFLGPLPGRGDPHKCAHASGATPATSKLNWVIRIPPSNSPANSSSPERLHSTSSSCRWSKPMPANHKRHPRRRGLILGDRLNKKVIDNVSQTNEVSHTAASSSGRLLGQPSFAGVVPSGARTDSR
jgi:hypothetical protein